MESFPYRLSQKLQKRSSDNALRTLSDTSNLIDFSSNDYLGFSNHSEIQEHATALTTELKLKQKGAGGSRLLTGNHELFGITEALIASCHKAEAALIYTSGYNANLGFFECVPQKDDLILFDEYSHASIREGIRLSRARSLKFEHNSLEDLLQKLEHFRRRNPKNDGEVYVVTETVFSMDGDTPDLFRLASICREKEIRLVLDEAHALGVMGNTGLGLSQEHELHKSCFARLYTYGKALGGHGAAIVGSQILKDYLINFSKSLIYTTALGPLDVAWIHAGYKYLESDPIERSDLNRNIAIFKNIISEVELDSYFVSSSSAIQCCVLPDNSRVRNISEELKKEGFDVRPILAPTVPEGKERLRFCLHSYNTPESIEKVVQQLATFVR